MYSCSGSDYSQHDRSQTRASPTSRARRGLCLYRHSDHVVDRGADRRFAQRQYVGARFASRYRLAGSHRVTRHHELVLSQNLLGRLDSRPQSPSQGITRECAHCRNFPGAPLVGILLLGFTSLYCGGFEVVLFLQSYHLRLGGAVVMEGAVLGIVLTGMVAVLTFVLQQRLPYRKMLITTGILLGAVLLVMVGEQTQEMQLAHWISTTEITSLKNYMPPWMGLLFAVFPTVETLVAQLIAAVLVIGSYFAARRFGGGEPGGTALETTPAARMAAINA